MQIRKMVGRGAGARKYDVLTILGSYALSQDRSLQRQTLRLICLLTARYNWQNDHLSVGQEEIARLWSVDPRTVKREMAAFRDRGWLVERRAAARGRVTLYGLGLEKILEDTRPVWEKVGPDLVARLDSPEAGPAPEVGTNVIPFPSAALPAEGRIWPGVAAILNAEHPSVYQAWFSTLSADEDDEGLTLRAPGAFHAVYLRTHYQTLLQSILARIAPQAQLRISG